jgi:carbon-monoxide dehydrogenase small subunit
MPDGGRETAAEASVTGAGQFALGAELAPITLTVNDKPYSVTVEARMLLVDLLREVLDLTGTHVGCDTSYCGACTVLLNGRAVKSCTMFAVQAHGSKVTTVEGLAEDGKLNPLQKAFAEHHGLQCGYCTPGMLMTATELLADKPEPSDDEILKAIAGNTCRCTGYQNILKSIRAASQAGIIGGGG